MYRENKSTRGSIYVKLRHMFPVCQRDDCSA